MSSTVEQWPLEVMEAVNTYLTLDDMRTLRLTSKTMAASVAQDTFESYFHTKHIEMLPTSLEAFKQATHPGLMGSRVKHLVLTGLAVNVAHLGRVVGEKARWVAEGNGPLVCSTKHTLTAEELAKAEVDLDELRSLKAELRDFWESETDVGMLADALRNLAAHGKHAKLASLTLEVKVLRDDALTVMKPIEARSTAEVWRVGEATFKTAFAGLVKSGLPVESLDAFGGQWHCSLPWLALGVVHRFSKEEMAPSLRALKSLSLSLSDFLHDESEEGGADADDEGERRGPADQERLHSKAGESMNAPKLLAVLLRQAPQLGSLHLHWCLLRSSPSSNIDFRSAMLKNIAQLQAARKLRALTLRGFRLKSDILLNLLKSAPIKTLRLENVNLQDDPNLHIPPPSDDEDEDEDEDDHQPSTYTPPPSASGWHAIFGYCTSSAAAMSSLHFDDLWSSRLLYFRGVPGGPKFPHSRPVDGCPTLHRQGEEVRRGIEFSFARGRSLGSPQAWNWRKGREREYGPA